VLESLEGGIKRIQSIPSIMAILGARCDLYTLQHVDDVVDTAGLYFEKGSHLLNAEELRRCFFTALKLVGRDELAGDFSQRNELRRGVESKLFSSVRRVIIIRDISAPLIYVHNKYERGPFT